MTADYMLRALELARQARGTTAPNPPVGAVLVREGDIVGEGKTRPGGRPHAEVVALEAAGDKSAGARLYVTLEPCSHWGKTPPCADALVAVGIRHASIALLDPNPEVQGHGVSLLRDAGVLVSLGDFADEAAEIAEGHLTFMRLGRPFVTVATEPSPALMHNLVREHDLTILGPKQADLPDEIDRPFLRVHRNGASLHVRRHTPRHGDVSSTLSRTFQAPGYRELVELLGRSGHRAILVLADREMEDAIASDSLIDKLVLPEGAPHRIAFVTRRRVGLPDPHCLLYPSSEGE